MKKDECPEKQLNFKSLTKPFSAYAAYKPNPVIESLIDEQSCTLIFAPSGGMKSLFCLDLATSIAQGGSFLGLDCHRFKTLYLDGEMSPVTIGKRYESFNRPDIGLSDLGYLCVSLDESLEGIDFRDTQQKEDFSDFLIEEKYEVVILDNIRTLISVDDENSASEFDAFNRFVKTLRNRGLTVVVVHHSNKSKNHHTYAGSSNIATVFNTIIGLNDGELEGTRKLEVHKARDSDAASKIHGKLIEFENGKFKFLGIEDYSLEDCAYKILEYIENNPPSIERVREFMRSNLKLSVASGKSSSWKLIYQNYIDGFATTPQAKNYEAFEKLINKSKSLHQ